MLSLEEALGRILAHADLRTKQIQAGIRIGLSAVGKMLVNKTSGRFPLIAHFVGNAEGPEAIEGEVLSLRAIDIGVAVDPSEPHTAGFDSSISTPSLKKPV